MAPFAGDWIDTLGGARQMIAHGVLGPRGIARLDRRQDRFMLGQKVPERLPRNIVDDVAADPQSQVRRMFPEIDGYRVTGTPVKLSATPGSPSTGAPQPGRAQQGKLLGSELCTEDRGQHGLD